MNLKALHTIKGLKKGDEYTLPGEIFEAKGKQAKELIESGAAEKVVVVQEGSPKGDLEKTVAGFTSEIEGLRKQLEAAGSLKAKIETVSAGFTAEIEGLRKQLEAAGADAEKKAAIEAEIATSEAKLQAVQDLLKEA